VRVVARCVSHLECAGDEEKEVGQKRDDGEDDRGLEQAAGQRSATAASCRARL